MEPFFQTVDWLFRQQEERISKSSGTDGANAQPDEPVALVGYLSRFERVSQLVLELAPTFNLSVLILREMDLNPGGDNSESSTSASSNLAGADQKRTDKAGAAAAEVKAEFTGTGETAVSIRSFSLHPKMFVPTKASDFPETSCSVLIFRRARATAGNSNSAIGSAASSSAAVETSGDADSQLANIAHDASASTPACSAQTIPQAAAPQPLAAAAACAGTPTSGNRVEHVAL